MKRRGRCIPVVLAIAVCLSSICLVSAESEVLTDANEYNVESIQDVGKIDKIELENIDVLEIENMESQEDVEVVEEVLLDGVDVMLEGELAANVAKEIDESFELENSNSEMSCLGVYIENDNGNISSTEIDGMVINEENGEIDKEATMDLPGKVEIDVCEIANDVANKDDEVLSSYRDYLDANNSNNGISLQEVSV